MRFTPTLLVFALYYTHTSALTFPNVTLGVDNYKHINPSNGLVDLPTKSGILTQIEARSWTNARRLAAGKPLKPPTVVLNSGKHHPKPSSIPIPIPYVVPPGFLVPPAVPTATFTFPIVGATTVGEGEGEGDTGQMSTSSIPGSDTSCIQVMSTTTGSLLGYISHSFNGFGEYALTPDMPECLVVHSPASPIEKGVKYDLETRNGPDAKFPYIGIVEGDKTTNPVMLEPGSNDYGVLAARRALNPLSQNSFSDRTGHAKSSQSTVWKIDTNTQNVHVNWENADGSNMDLHTGMNEDTFIVTGDKDAFTNTYGPTTWVNFKYIPV